MHDESDSPASTSCLWRVVNAVAEAGGPDAAFAAVAEAANTLIGHRLFTVMAFDADAMRVQRLYSSNPRAYPPGGRKDKRDTPWGRLVLEQGRPFIGWGADEIRANFDDHHVILGLGLDAVLNVPVRVCGRTIGTMNLLRQGEHYETADLEWGFFLAGQLVGPLCLAAGRP